MTPRALLRADAALRVERRAQHAPPTLRAAINRMCDECMACEYDRREAVVGCEHFACPLWPVRPGPGRG